MYEELSGLDAPGDDVVIRRYMSMAKVVSLLTTRQLYFAALQTFDDRFEGSVPIAGMANDPTIIQFGEALRAGTRANCWYEEDEESDALWRLYADKNETVCVRSTVGALKLAITSASESIAISRVRYVDPRGFPWPADGLLRPFIYKRRCFAHEREIRAFVIPNIDASLDAPTVQGCLITVNVEQLVEQVVVSPYANDWLLEAVQQLVQLVGLGASVVFSESR